MPVVIGEFEQGSVWDSRMLFTGVLSIIAAFLSTYESDIWDATDKLLIPLLTIGICLIILNVLIRIIRPKLQVTLLEIDGDRLKIRPVKNLQFSGWIPGKPLAVNISVISSVKAYDFYNPGSNTGMYWICLECTDKSVIELNIDDPGLVEKIIVFFESWAPGVEVKIDAKMKT